MATGKSIASSLQVGELELAKLYALKDALAAVQVFGEENGLPTAGWVDDIGWLLHAELKRWGVPPRFAQSWEALCQ